MVTLAALDSLRVEISVDEMDIASVALGQSVRLAFQALDGDAYEGTVVRISTQGQSDQGLVTFPIEIEITAPDERLLAGLSADVTIIAAESLNAMVVPRSAVQETPRGSIVMVVGSDGSTAPRLVQTGVSNDLFVEIVDGLTEGEEVLAAGASAFAGRGALQGQIPGSREGLSQRPPGGGFALGGFTRVIGGGGR